MITYDDIIKEDNLDLRVKCEDVKLPLSKEDKETLIKMNDYLEMGYDEKFAKKHNIRPGVGLAAPQIDVLKKMFVVLAFDENDELHHYAVINPKIISQSVALTYLPSGEGCLSVDRNVDGYIHRPKKIIATCYLYDFEADAVFSTTLTLKNYVAIVFQHEYDHLFGTLFIDRINKENPFYIPENSTPIKFGQPSEDK